MRTVVSAIPREVKDGFKYDEIPWQQFPHFYGPGEEIPGLLATLASGDAEAAGEALWQLWTDLHHQGSTIAVTAICSNQRANQGPWAMRNASRSALES
ncbi:hypothetical protein [Streptomyces sp. NBC_01445]|uniref:hypothetical protein n=1 Tax=Streptomyces sp. NBC_01445 TaxID=2903869 RepID=UPI002DD92669|nr:hypothetical protein [Streptomyces sp. NBC_01445]WSE03883.1 hypothetical protein OG574_11185 [Streptomyces sp. NBC_01445]